MKSKKVIITIPAYNEESTIARTMEEIKQVMNPLKYSYEIQVVNDGSTDRTSDVAKKIGAKVISHKRNLGLARTFQTELENCLRKNADIIVHTDADGQYPASSIPELIMKIEQGYDIVLGSRFISKSGYKNELSRKLGNVIFAKVISKLTKTKLTDTTTGFRAFTSEVASNIKFINTFTYTQEQIIKAAKQGFSIAEIPIQARETRKSKLFSNPLQYAIKAWLNILRIYRDYDPLRFFVSIGGFFFTLGSIIGLYFIYLHYTSGIQGHLGLLFLMLVLLMTGLQIGFFGFLADMRRVD
ncbi:MAG TPA: glycosyltransferase family 2 protein [Candidatus Nanoarchaeia archaeon]|nr:glycosyltransferase family 2 protein [Candidatus Nanoarchaeia archaeon]